MFNVSDPDDTFNLTLVGENRPVVYNISPTAISGKTGSYILAFVPSRDSINVRIEVQDSAGGVAEHRVATTLCPCENSQPCVQADTGVDGGESGSVVLTCDCGEGWSSLLILLFLLFVLLPPTYFLNF